jgi:cellulose synthase operon protein C
MQSADNIEAQELIAGIRSIEGERGTHWRLSQAVYVLAQARRDSTKDLKTPRDIAAQLAVERPDWWGTSVLRAEIAELEGNAEEAIRNYTQAIELGNSQPNLARRLFGLLAQKNDFGQIDHLINILSNRGTAVGDLTIAATLEAIRRRDFDQGVALAREVFSESSTLYSDHLFLAQVYGAAGRPKEAGKELSKAVELGPSVPVTWVSYIQYLVTEKRMDEARAAIERARKSIPADRANLTLAQCYWLVGEHERAETLVQAALQSPACDLATIQAAVDFHTKEGRFDQVEPILEKLNAATMKMTPQIEAWANRERIKVWVRSGRPADVDRALVVVDENLKANPSSVDDIAMKARLLATSTGRKADVIKLLEPIDQAKRLVAAEQFLLAQTYLSERHVDKYRSEMEKILGAAVKNPQHLAHFIDFLIDRKELDQADKWLLELQSVAPRSLVLLERKARVLELRDRKSEVLELLLARGRQAPAEIGSVATLLERFGFVKEAEAAYNAFIDGSPKEPDRSLVMASFLARQSRTKDAVAIIEKARTTCRPEAIARIALALYNAPSADDSLRRQVEAWVSEAIRKSPSTTLAFRPRLATIYLMQGRYDDAETLLRKALVNDPKPIDALNALAWLLSLRQTGESREALALIDRAIEKGGPISTLVDTRAVVLIRSGEPGRAAEVLLAAQQADPRNVSLALHLAWAYQVAGKITAAREQFHRAQELGLKPADRDPLERVVIDGLEKVLAPDQVPGASGG